MQFEASMKQIESRSQSIGDQQIPNLQELVDKFEVQESTARSERGLSLISSLPNGGGMNQASL